MSVNDLITDRNTKQVNISCHSFCLFPRPVFRKVVIRFQASGTSAASDEHYSMIANESATLFISNVGPYNANLSQF